MKKYFIYEFKKSIFLIGVLSAIAVALSLIQFITIKDEAAGISSLSTILFLAAFLAFLLPFWIFSYKMKKRSVDLFYALPLSHTNIAIVKFLVGLAILYIPFTVSYWISFLILACMAQGLNVVYYIPMYFASIIPLYLMYAISAFLYTRANRRRDGQAFSILWYFAIPLVLSVIARFFPVSSGYADSSILGEIIGSSFSSIIPAFFSPATPITFVGTMFSIMATSDYAPIAEFINSSPIILGNMCAGFAFVTLCGIGSTVGLLLWEKKAKAENTEQLSESWFGYKVLIPLYGACLTSFSMEVPYVALIFIIIIFIIMFAMSASYRRTVKIGWVQLAIIGGSIVLGVILYYLGNLF